MPLVRVDLIRGRGTRDVRTTDDEVQRSLIDILKFPERDRFQSITQHEPDENRLWRPTPEPLCVLADLRVVLCTDAAPVARDRIVRRAVDDPHRAAHADHQPPKPWFRPSRSQPRGRGRCQ
ncbi:hypothetical protein [Streptomyces sp. NPDC001508]|uniref:hypothetical protein n=1 Tax=Streptomyces sp. NPDC001508 TaxID=3154656 RepID=UPI003320AE0D